jgi:hypothetical protein
MKPFLALFILSPFATSAAEVSFNRDIRPLFSKHCTACHGGVKAAGGISLVYQDKAMAEGKSGERAVVPGKPLVSELIKRVTSTDPDDVMPKPDHGPRLSEEEIALLTRWIEQGAKWSEHWAFVPPVEAAPPVLKQADWPRSRMDAWVLARLEAEGMTPSAAANAAEWLRRATLDLTGLPPTLADYDAFVADGKKDAQAAKERVVERLLKSEHFGERWASVWLDLARYSDTFGFEKDPHRDIWPWRDWVIRAFNADMPFDQFTIKQLAGDLLPDASGDDLLATAFHRNTQNNTEGGTDDEEFRTAAVLDRVNTTWTTWQATTFGCVQCHAHPYDPFPHEDYYRFAAFFNNTEDTDLNDDFPRLSFPQEAKQRDEAARLHREQTALRESLNADGVRISAQIQKDWKAWSPQQATLGMVMPVVNKEGQVTASNKPVIMPEAKLTIGDQGLVVGSGTLPVGVVYSLTMPMRESVTALRLQILPDSDDPKKTPERGAVLSQLALYQVTPDGRHEAIKVREVFADYLAGPYDPQSMLNADKDGFGSYPVQTGARWCVVTLDAPLKTVPGAALKLFMEQSAGANSGFQGVPLRRFIWSTTSDRRWIELAQDKERLSRVARLNELRDKLKKLGGVKVPVLMERTTAAQRATRVFVRGNRASLDELVQPGIPLVSRPPEKTKALTRLDMARWLVSEQNTLTARVLANRLWAELFGRGIVPTLEDFGTSGERPSHPELMDHLALRLMKHHRWSVKSFLREIVLSATYGQTSKATKQAIERDPLNTLLARGPRSRLTAEMVRDQALQVSGLLAPKLFGAPVYPPQPEGVWNSVYNGAKWETSKGGDRYRRAIYTYCKRTSGYPGFLTFDAPMRDACTARRIPTNTPLQALVTLNDPAFIEMAEALAKSMAEQGKTVRDQVAYGCRLFTLAPPPQAMIDTLVKLHDRALAEPGTDKQKAMTLVANTLLNMDYALVR